MVNHFSIIAQLLAFIRLNIFISVITSSSFWKLHKHHSNHSFSWHLSGKSSSSSYFVFTCTLHMSKASWNLQIAYWFFQNAIRGIQNGGCKPAGFHPGFDVAESYLRKSIGPNYTSWKFPLLNQMVPSSWKIPSSFNSSWYVVVFNVFSVLKKKWGKKNNQSGW